MKIVEGVLLWRKKVRLFVEMFDLDGGQERRFLVENMLKNKATALLHFNFLVTKWEM